MREESACERRRTAQEAVKPTHDNNLLDARDGNDLCRTVGYATVVDQTSEGYENKGRQHLSRFPCALRMTENAPKVTLLGRIDDEILIDTEQVTATDPLSFVGLLA